MNKRLKVFVLLFCTGYISAQNSWNKYPLPVLQKSTSLSSWKRLATADAFVMVDNDTLKMWYAASGVVSTDVCDHVRIGYAWSLDGIAWNEYAGNPVLSINTDSTKFDADGVETPTVIKDLNAVPSQRYKLWYAGRKLSCSSVQDHEIGYAYSPDGKNWTKYSGNPVIVPGNMNSWYNTAVYGPSVILENGIYKMWFTTLDAFANSQPTDGKGSITYATSNDGINWSINSSPVLIGGLQNNWDTVVCAEPSVIKVGNTYHMFYSALNSWSNELFQVGYATSTDGINWIKSLQNPVLKIGSTVSWDRYWASHPTVIYDSISNKFKMWYTGRDTANINFSTTYYWDIGYAESTYIMTSINKQETANGLGINVSPNPANSFVKVHTQFDLLNAEVGLYNNLGQKMNANMNVDKNSIEIQTYNMSNGIYLIEIQVGELKFNKKIIIIN